MLELISLQTNAAIWAVGEVAMELRRLQLTTRVPDRCWWLHVMRKGAIPLGRLAHYLMPSLRQAGVDRAYLAHLNLSRRRTSRAHEAKKMGHRDYSATA